MIKIGEGHKSEVFLLPDGRILKLFFPHLAELAPEEAEIARSLGRSLVQLANSRRCTHRCTNARLTIFRRNASKSREKSKQATA